MADAQRPGLRTAWVVWDNDADRPQRGAKTHAHGCYVVDPNRPGPRHEFREIAAADLPHDVGRCEICGGGRPADKPTSGLPSVPSRQAGVAAHDASPHEVIAPGRSFRVRDNRSGSELTFVVLHRGDTRARKAGAVSATRPGLSRPKLRRGCGCEHSSGRTGTSLCSRSTARRITEPGVLNALRSGVAGVRPSTVQTSPRLTARLRDEQLRD
jgi:hypothetical protein